MILVIGETGQVAHALRELAQESGELAEWEFWPRSRLDLEYPEAIATRLREARPRLIINAAAYTAVDKAESERDKAFKINGAAVGALGRYCRERGIPLIHISTEYVYSGSGDTPHFEIEPREPLNVYGQSKAEGERELEESGAKFLIFRTSWIYHHQGANFVRTILRLAAEREQLSIVADQVGAPTSARDLAEVLMCVARKCLEPGFDDWGVYNIAGAGETSWYGFALAIVDEANALGYELRVREIRPIPSSDYPTPARRPLNSRLNQDKLFAIFALRLPSWRHSLRLCLERMSKRR